MQKKIFQNMATLGILLLFVGCSIVSSVSGTGTNNLPPETPGAPSGPALLFVGENGHFSTSATDSDGDYVSYRFDWNATGAHDYSGWTPLVPSGEPGSKMHSWDSPGTYVVRAQARDEHWAFSNWSSDLVVIIVDNSPPNIPSVPSGPTAVVVGETTAYSTSAIDPDGNQVAYLFDWDVTGAHDYSGWMPLVPSGESGSITHIWHTSGAYVVRAQARDEHWAFSGWSGDLVVVVHVNTPPVANDDYATVLENSQNNQNNVLANDSDVDGDMLSVVSVTQPSHGSSSTDGAFCYYTPASLYSGSDSFTYVINDGHGGSATAAIFLTVTHVNNPSNIPPIVDFTFQPTFPTINDTIIFTDASSDLDGHIVGWAWHLSDGTNVNARNLTHQFADNRITYDITLNATDNDGGVSSLTKHIIMRAAYSTPTLPGVDTVVDLRSQIDISVTVHTTSATSIDISRYSGNPVGENITHNIAALGKYYDVSVLNENVIQWPITIKFYYTQSDLDASHLDESQLCGVYFWNTTAGQWELCNDTGVNTTYNQDGYEGYCWVTLWHLTTFTLGGDNEPPSKVTGLTVTNEKDGKLLLGWNSATDNIGIDHYKIYRDGVFVHTETTATYQDTGLVNGHSYTYIVSAVDASGNEGTPSDPSSGTPTASASGGTGGNDGGGGGTGGGNLPPVANLSAGKPYQGFINSDVTFNGSSSHDSDGNIVKWFWTFGDNTNATGNIVLHSYSKIGTYTVTLTVTDDQGATGKDQTTCVIVQPNRPPSPPLIGGTTSGKKKVLYSYTARATDLDNDTLQYTFTWGNGASSMNESGFLPNGAAYTAAHMWSTAGKYTVIVQVSDNHTVSSSAFFVYIDAINVGTIGYLTDDNGDGIYDTFHNGTTGQQTALVKTGSSYLIDSNGDGTADYIFNPVIGLMAYQTQKNSGIPGFELILVVIAISFVVFWTRKKSVDR